MTIPGFIAFYSDGKPFLDAYQDVILFKTYADAKEMAGPTCYILKLVKAKMPRKKAPKESKNG